MSSQDLDKFWRESIKHLMVNAMISSPSGSQSNPLIPFQADSVESISSSSPVNVNSTTVKLTAESGLTPGSSALVEMTANLVADIITNLSTSLNQIQAQQQQPKRKRKRRRRRYSLAQRQKFLQENIASNPANDQYHIRSVIR